jgi:hypothetical protein
VERIIKGKMKKGIPVLMNLFLKVANWVLNHPPAGPLALERD